MSWAVETLIATSLLMLLVLLLRRPVARNFGAGAAYALWLVPLTRLLLPAMPFEIPAPTIWIDVSQVPAAGPALGPASFPLWSFVMVLWVGGALLFLGWHALAYRRFLRNAVRLGHPIATPEVSDAAVIATPAVTGPAATGLIVRRILVPHDFIQRFSPEQQKLAIAHEALHHRRGDIWASAAALLFLAFHWFNPIAHIAHRAFRRDLEAACDSSLLDIWGAAARQDYAQTILRCAGQPMPHTSCALTPIGELKGRLEMLNLHHGKMRRLSGTALAAALAGGGLMLAQPVAAQDKPAEERTERVEVRRIITDGKETPDQLRRALPGDLREKMAKCDGEKFEADTTQPGAGGDANKARTRIVICAKPGSSKADTAAALEKVLSRLEGTSDVPAENKAQIVARLKARIAELKAGS